MTGLETETAFDSIISLRNVDFAYRKRVIFQALNLELNRGLNYVVGENGAGKTTLFRLIMGHLKVAAGSVTIDGQPARASRLDIGYLPQRFSLPNGLTVRQFVEYAAWVRGMGRELIPAATETALRRTGLADRADERIGRLSGGMMRRVGIAQAIATDCSVLLLDEPAAGLDPMQRADLRRTLSALRGEIAVVVSTHLMADVAAADNLVVLRSGSVLFEGTVDDFKQHVGPGESDASLEDMFVALHEDAGD